MKCGICGKTPAEGTNLYRQNQKSEPGVWACYQHSKPIDEQLIYAVGNLQREQKRKNNE